MGQVSPKPPPARRGWCRPHCSSDLLSLPDTAACVDLKCRRVPAARALRCLDRGGRCAPPLLPYSPPHTPLKLCIQSVLLAADCTNFHAREKAAVYHHRARWTAFVRVLYHAAGRRGPRSRVWPDGRRGWIHVRRPTHPQQPISLCTHRCAPPSNTLALLVLPPSNTWQVWSPGGLLCCVSSRGGRRLPGVRGGPASATTLAETAAGIAAAAVRCPHAKLLSALLILHGNHRGRLADRCPVHSQAGRRSRRWIRDAFGLTDDTDARLTRQHISRQVRALSAGHYPHRMCVHRSSYYALQRAYDRGSEPRRRDGGR